MAENTLSAEEREVIRREEHENALVTQARHRLPFVVPWANEIIVPGKGFQSGNIFGDPWVASSPFIPLDQHQRCMIYQPNGDAHAHYCSAESQSHESSTEHYSASIGATVDVKFASANVTGSFDKTVQENKDSNKVSRNVFFRAGVVQFAEEPALSLAAQALLEKPNGEQAFQSQFGDYYVAGITLGGDSGAFLSADMDTKTTTTTETLKATIKVLFFKPKTWQTSMTQEKVDSSVEVTIFGYDTMKNIKAVPKKLPLEAAGQQVLNYTEMADSLDDRIIERIADLGIKKGQKFTFRQYLELFSSGVVVQLHLAPFHTLMEYKRAVAAQPVG